jgi:hypothetical protein
MSIVDSTIIDVFNYSDSVCVVSSQIKPDGYLFEPARDGVPYSIPLSYSEIRVINSQSDVFRNGLLWFDKEIEEEIYTILGIRDWKNILSDLDIRNIILNPTKDGLEKIIKISNGSMFERVRGMFIQLQNTGMYDVSMRVANVINARYDELYMGKRNSEIKITSSLPQSQNIDTSEIVKNEIAKMKEELAKQIREELEAQYKSNSNVEPKNVVEDEIENKTVTKKAGRPSAK